MSPVTFLHCYHAFTHRGTLLPCAAGMVPLMVVYYFLQKYYRRTYVELQRCDATSRSPVYAHFSESLTGVETIRAFGYQQRFADKSDNQIDYNHRQAHLAASSYLHTSWSLLKLCVL